ncbi:NYN domain-containing protein [Polaromonas sp.]|uniref:NYN domain-containing protein n=1 Tax=Polaromonas sp. TaxID=1869339 RepID=UPI00356B17EF
MERKPLVALLIDADNLSAASDVEEVFRQLDGLGLSVSVRRAYGGHDKLAGIKDVLRRNGVRALINQGKGTTDVALVVDAMDLMHNDSLPTSVAIASSDADFAPLALRLREAGMRVICFARREKADADALQMCYADVRYVDGEPKRSPARKTPAPAPVSAVVSAPKVAPTARRAPTKKAPPQGPEAILKAVPALRTGKPVPMNDVVKRLRDEKILSKHGKLATLLRNSGADFRLSPEAAPTQVQWIDHVAR